jgi:hypothetical protein
MLYESIRSQINRGPIKIIAEGGGTGPANVVAEEGQINKYGHGYSPSDGENVTVYISDHEVSKPAGVLIVERTASPDGITNRNPQIVSLQLGQDYPLPGKRILRHEA